VGVAGGDRRLRRVDISRAAFYPEDDDFLAGREESVTHYTVA
jgi:hypothetical protein